MMLYYEFKVGDLITWNPDFVHPQSFMANESKCLYKLWGPDAVFEVLQTKKTEEYNRVNWAEDNIRINRIRLPDGRPYTCGWMPIRFKPSGPLDITKMSVRQLSRMIRYVQV